VQSLANDFKKQQTHEDSHLDYDELKPVRINRDISPSLIPLGKTVGTRKMEGYFNY